MQIDEDTTNSWANWLRCFVCRTNIQILRAKDGSTHIFCPSCNRMVGSAEFHKGGEA